MELEKAIEVVTEAAKQCEAAKGTRHLVVLDRGFIFAGNLAYNDKDDWYTLTSVVNVRKWKKNGFGGLVKSAKDAEATLDPCGTIKFKNSALIFVAPISKDWANGC